MCPICKGSNETICHALVECLFATKCWTTGFSRINFTDPGDFYQWLKRNFQSVSSERHAEIAAICWAIWMARNGVVWNQKQVQVHEMIASAKYYLVQWRNAQCWSTKALFQNLIVGDGADKWMKP